MPAMSRLLPYATPRNAGLLLLSAISVPTLSLYLYTRTLHLQPTFFTYSLPPSFAPPASSPGSSPASTRPASSTSSTPSIRTSGAATHKTVNPRSHEIFHDTFTSAAFSTTLTDEQILARFTKGFFGGKIFWFERTVFNLVSGPSTPRGRSGVNRVVGYTGFEDLRPVDARTGVELEQDAIPRDGEDAGEEIRKRRGGWKGLWWLFNLYSPKGNPQIWDKAEIPRDEVLPLGTILYGGFQVVARHIVGSGGKDDGTVSLVDQKNKNENEVGKPVPGDKVPGDQTGALHQSGSYLDFGFGSDLSPFAGAHRFEVLRTGQEKGMVRLRLAHFRCNPLTDGPSAAEWILWFHLVYAHLLFRDSVSEVRRG